MSIIRPLAGFLATVVATAVSYQVWLGRHVVPTVDPETGRHSGPWSILQVTGCLVTMIVILAAAILWWVPPLAAGVAVTATFAASWCISSLTVRAGEATVLSGAVLLLFVAAGCFVVGLIMAPLRRPRQPYLGDPRR